MPHISRRIVVVLFIALFLIAAGSSLFFYSKYRSLAKEPASSGTQEIASLLATVGKLMILPEGETPSVATVSDVEKLKNQPFFVAAQNGDKVILFANARKAILYRPSENKIVDVAPITVNAATQSAEQQKQYTVVLLNGTTTTGLTKRYEPVIKAKTPNIVVSDRDNAARSDYSTSILIDVSGTKERVAQTLAAALGLTVGMLPEGEKTPVSDFLIILGQDQK